MSDTIRRYSPFMRIILCILAIIYLVVIAACQPVRALSLDSQELELKIIQVLKDHPEVILESVETYQEQQYAAQQEAQRAYIKEIQSNPDQLIGHSPITSDSKGKLLMVEFADFQCPYCAVAHESLKAFVADHANEVALVYKHYPLANIHPEAVPAAQAAWAAGQQGKFWEYHGLLFEQQERLDDTVVVELAKSLNLDLDQFNRDRNSSAAAEAIEKDMQLADQLGIDGTPFLVMGDQVMAGAVEREVLEEALSNQL
ncbi:DsbA family protein [Leptothoe sp. LEGE 181152]|nr:DsbA family protein [Leptothoe sp. LEGE 181152]